jgi:glycosyltransferase involved in cell wall biosynthesis
LIDAAKDMKNTIVMIAGKSEDKDVCRKLLAYEKRLPQLRVFAKWIPDEEIQYYFNACDIVVLPYTDITTSGVIPLAYAFSRPIITTNIGGLNDIVNDDTGIIVPAKDVGALRNAIENIFRRDLLAMGKCAYEYSRKEFSWESNAQKIGELYELLRSMD